MWPLTAQEIYEILIKKTCEKKHYKNLFISGACTDSRKIKEGECFVAIEGEKIDAHCYINDCFSRGARLALVNKNSPFLKKLNLQQRQNCIEVENVLTSYRELAKFMRQRFSFPVIGIGGSNGKTTTKEMLVSLLGGDNYKVTKTEKSENGFLGIAMTLCQKDHNVKEVPHALVLEIGIDDINAMKEHVAVSEPDISLLTALGPEHLEHLKDWKTASREELVLFKNKRTKRIWQFGDEKIQEAYIEYAKKNYLLLKHDCIVVEKKEFMQINKKKTSFLKYVDTIVVWQFVNETTMQSEIKLEILKNGVKFFSIENLNFIIPLPGRHNAQNFSLSFAAAFLLNRTLREIKNGWNKFVPPPMRSRIVTLKNGAILFDDSYNASPMSIEAALTVLENKEWEKKKKIVVLGDMLDLGKESKYWHEQLFKSVRKLRRTRLCFYGSAMYNCYKLMKEIEDIIEKKNETQIFWLSKEKNPADFFKSIEGDLNKFVILIKGSRGMNLDRLVKNLEEQNF